MPEQFHQTTNTAVDNSTNVNSQTGAKALGTGATASNTGAMTQQQNVDPQTADQAAKLLADLIAVLDELQVPNRGKLDETIAIAEEARETAESSNPDKGKLSTAWGKVKGWVDNAIGAGLFVEATAERVRDLVERLGALVS